MDARVFSDFRHYSGNTARDDLLRIGLPRVDHVINFYAAAEVRVIEPGFSLSYPEIVIVRIFSKDVEVEIESELAELPQLIRDVFAGVRYSSVRANNDLV